MLAKQELRDVLQKYQKAPNWDRSMEATLRNLLSVLRSQSRAAKVAMRYGLDPKPHLEATHLALKSLRELALFQALTSDRKDINVIVNVPQLRGYVE